MALLDAPAVPRRSSDIRYNPARISAGEGAKVYKAGASDGTNVTMNSRHRMVAAQRTLDLTVKYGNWYYSATTDVAGANDIVVRAAVEYPSGTFYPLFFGGQRDITVQPGATVESQPLALDIPTRTSFWVRTFVTVASGGKWPLGKLAVQAGTYQEAYEYGSGLADKTTSGSISMTSGGNTISYGPCQVLCLNTNPKPAVVLVGDSITDGTGDTTFYEQGWAMRAFSTAGFPTHVIAQPGQQGAQFVVNTMHRRMDLARAARAAVVMYGRNDLTANRTAAQIQSALSAVYSNLAARGMLVYAATVPPYTSSTDSWATTGNQTNLDNATDRPAVNDWIRSLPSPLSGYFETADAVETSRASGIWQANFTTDGKHPNSAGHAAMAAAVNTGIVR